MRLRFAQVLARAGSPSVAVEAFLMSAELLRLVIENAEVFRLRLPEIKQFRIAEADTIQFVAI